jgi:hypothetical protein
MDDLSRAYYEVVFERDFLKKTGSQFQDFFSEAMEKRYPGDYIRVRPWGNVGDRKNDGYLRSERILFQVYAPNDLTAAEAIAKINEDFNGALPYWQQHFDTWTFVHNSRNGLGPDVTKRLLDLDEAHRPLRVLPWGFEEIRQRVFTLNLVDLASLLGPAPSRKDVLNVGFEELQVVLSAIARQRPVAEHDLRPVPPGKLLANGLSGSVKDLLTAGMSRSSLVGQFFQQHSDPNYGDEVVQAFRIKYRDLRAAETDPDIIFKLLYEFAGGYRRGEPSHETAVLAVLAYLFEQCDIFERPREGCAP